MYYLNRWWCLYSIPLVIFIHEETYLEKNQRYQDDVLHEIEGLILSWHIFSHTEG
jgi:hypothetical protein